MNNQFRIKNKKLNLVAIIIGSFACFLFLVSLIGFLFTSFYSIDLKLAIFFEKGFKYEIVRYWSVFYDILGTTELVVFMLFNIMVLIESWFLFKIKKQNNNFWKKNKWLLKLVYILVYFGFVIIKCITTYFKFNADNGFGNSGDAIYLLSNKYRNVGLIISLIIHCIGLFIGFYVINYKFKNDPSYLVDKYWIQASKILFIVFVSYTIIVLLKGMTSRPYYYNIIYGDLLEQLRLDNHNDWVDYYLNQSTFKYGFNIGDNKYANNIPGEWPWYKINESLFKPDKNSVQYKHWFDWTFPSGHVAATLIIGCTFFYFLTNNQKLTLIKIILLSLYFLHLISMSFAIVVNRGHWISDITFTYLWLLPLIFITHFISLKLIVKWENKKKL
ncbi:phosphatase PAP2 family protein [Mycoplasma mycoides]|uniref:phosphatase PAP2 family protein n=1 Tax=Mycoplasma mycoides TaxID=2102 RepID=UPI003DA5D6A5